ncbi:FHA domain-containing protein PS1 [Selaginella moellendorffii]|nr:FHA domain-containing protein PS1 [Selaginella moellendorffii]XP_024526569.1 FHA domain-containing protein PS1 [Selaginella moellendorffii]|eukprot:XP_024526568.1 FHA domain-containing protein PS1 [Selaginella moellendorffii]
MMHFVPQLVVLKDGSVVDNVLLHGKDSFVLGRHQNCDVVAGHASISRHHLEIRIIPETRQLVLKDMHSVHGTRLNGEPLIPLDPVIMEEDGKFEVGASTRTYMVKWIPVAQEQSDSSSSSCTPAKSTASSVAKGLDEEFQSILRLESSNSRKQENADRGAKKQPERLAFSDINGRTGSPPARPKSPARGNKGAASPLSAKFTALRMSPAGKKIFGVQKPEQSPSTLWLRRGVNLELPSLVTNTQASATPEDGYVSDKENMTPALVAKPEVDASKSVVSRKPFGELFFLPSPSVQRDYKPVFQPAPYSTSSDEDSFKEYCARRHRVTEKKADEVKWHIIVDTNCFLDEDGFNSLKKLEGLRETRVIIPKIVIRELDFLKRSEDKKYQCRRSLRWIEECMVKKPWWIHVQKSNEMKPMGMTPPVSPSVAKNFLPYAVDLLSPTNDDHVLDCALLFERSVVDGRVVLLTSDTALKIKAMAEGLVAESSTSFCESLLNPYSKRFLWAGSTVARSPVFCPLGLSPRGKNGGAGSGKLEALEDHPKGLQVVL